MDFPPWQTVYGWFRQWKRRGVTERILEELREQIRIAEGRDPQPSAGVIDSPSVKGADTVATDSRGYDPGKNVNGRKRLIITDTLGLVVSVTVLAASWPPARACRSRRPSLTAVVVGIVGGKARHTQATAELVQGPRDVQILMSVNAEGANGGGGH